MYDIENALRRRAMLERLEARDRAEAATRAAGGEPDPDPGRVDPVAAPVVPAAPTSPPAPVRPATLPAATTLSGLPRRPVRVAPPADLVVPRPPEPVVPRAPEPVGPRATETGPRPGGAYEAPARASYRGGTDRQPPRSATPQVYDRPPVTAPEPPRTPGNGDGMSPLHDDLSRRYRNGSGGRDSDGAISSVRPPADPPAPPGGTSPEVDDGALNAHLAAWQAITGLSQGTAGVDGGHPSAAPAPQGPGGVPPTRGAMIPPAAVAPVPPGTAVPPAGHPNLHAADDHPDDDTSTAATIADLLRQGGGGLFFRSGATDRDPQD